MQIEVSPENFHIIASLASETRLQILCKLVEGPMNIKSIAEAIGVTPTMIVKHIRILEEAGIVESINLPGVRGTQKVCKIIDKYIVLIFKKIEEATNSHTYSMPVGMFVDCDVSAPCGLSTTKSIIKFADNPQYFMDPEHVDASIVWFSQGWIEYMLPNYLLGNQRLTQIRISFEICSEAPGYNENFPSDIHFYFNNKYVGYWTSPGDFGEKPGVLTPKWWNFGTQYGLMKQITINEHGTFFDGIPSGEPNCTIQDFKFEPKKPIRFRIASPADARYPGGVNLFGSGFGNYDQDIMISLDYETI